MRRAQRLGRYGAVTQLVFAGVLGGIASLQPEPTGIPRGPVLLAVFLLPGVVGWIGADRRRPALLAAAAVTSGIGSFLAFSGVTLVFLLASAMFFASGIGLAAPGPGEPRGSFGAGIAQLIVGGAICVLLVGAGASAILVTDSACWITHQTATGSYIEMLPYSNGEMTLAGDATSGGCTNGLLSLRGVGPGALLAAAAIGLAGLASRRRKPPASDPQTLGAS